MLNPASEISTLPSLDTSNGIQPFANKLKGECGLVLLEKGTCSYRAGKRFAEYAFEKAPQILEASSFTEALILAKGKKTGIILLPHIHSLVAEVETSHGWTSMGSHIFRLTNPPLYLAKNKDSSNRLCATIDTLRPLVDKGASSIAEWLSVDTTQQAARACSEGRAEFCITNQNGLDKYKLSPIHELKEMEICWHPYWAGSTTPR